jgi:hypothetical protein
MENSNPHPGEEKPAESASQVDEKPVEEVSQTDTPASVISAAEPQKPTRSWLSRFFYTLLSPQTRLGRFMRPLLRWTAAIVGLFALGMLATYLLLYAPAAQQLAAAQADLQSAREQAGKTNAVLNETQKNLADLQTQYNSSQAALKKVGVRVSLLKVSIQVAAAQLALVNRDGAAAQKALVDARTILDQALPDVKSVDANAATQLDSRLTLVVSELNDPVTAQADLALLATRLSDLDSVLK